MATDPDITWAQEVIICDLCDTPARQFCNSCQVSLCLGCVGKHMDSIQTLKHDVVQFKDRKVQLVYEECGSHSGQRCEAHCSRCNVPICMICVISTHNGHTIRLMNDVVSDLKSEIQHETRDIESNILPLYKEMKKNIEKDIGKSTQKFNSLESDAEKLRKSWQQEVDAIFNKFCSLIKSMRENHLTVLTSHQSLIENQIQEMTKTVQQNNKLHQSNKVSEVTKHQSKLNEYKEIPTIIEQPIPSMKSNTDPGKELTIELEEYKATLKQAELSSQTDTVFSSMSTRDLLDKAEVVATFPTGVESLWRISCLGTEEAWLSGKGKTITRVDIDGFVRESVTSTCQKTPVDIAVTRKGELIYSDSEHGTVNIVKNGVSETLITAPRGWSPKGLCSTESGEILVNMNSGVQNKVVRYKNRKIAQEIFKDEKGDLIFGKDKWMLFLVENRNEDICVSDYNADSVVAVDKAGRVRFRYNGSPAGGPEPFSPRQIVTDSLGQIIVADYNNVCIHILEQNGQFLKCLDKCGFHSLCGLSIDNMERLWVGLIDNGNVKVIQYMK